MSASSRGIGELGYGTLYLPAFSFLYLAYLDGETMNAQISLLGVNLNFALGIDEPLLLALFALAFIGALEVHGVTRRIFGSEGPEETPKMTRVAQKHTVALVLDVHPEKIDEKPVKEWLFELSIFDFVVVLLRGLIFLPAAFLKPFVMISAGFLTILVLSGSSDPVGLFLLAGHAVLYLQNRVWSLLPPLHTDSPRQNVYMPEYREKGERSSQRRIDSPDRLPPKPQLREARGQTDEERERS